MSEGHSNTAAIPARAQFILDNNVMAEIVEIRVRDEIKKYVSLVKGNNEIEISKRDVNFLVGKLTNPR